MLGDALELFAIRDDVDAQYTAAKLNQELGGRAKPIPLNMEITEYLEPQKSQEFVARWRAAQRGNR